MSSSRPFAIVTGASTGIGFELARNAAMAGYDLLIAADEPEIQEAAGALRGTGIDVKAIEANLDTVEGVNKLVTAAESRPVDILVANAGRGLGKAFLDQDFDEALRVVNTNITGTIYLIHRVGNDMRAIGRGRILITGSIAGFMPGSYQAVYNGSKAFLDSFSFAIREELKDSGVSVTCLMPGATETEFFTRADMLDTKIGTEEKMSAAEVAKQGWEAVLRGDGQIITGWKNKLQAAMSHVLPADMVAEQHSEQAAPGTAKH
jgi:short-subunit dehydrogenase